MAVDRDVHERGWRDDIGRIILWSLAVYVIMTSVFIGIAAWSEATSVEERRSELMETQERKTDAERSVISAKMDGLISDVVYLHDTVDEASLDSGDHSAIIRDWISFSDHQMIYDQIRFIDVDGNEVIRVNYSAAGSYAVPDDQLQNKADRYYFRDSIGLGEDRIYVSPLDLNVEQQAVEKPDKPMVRFCIPWYDAAGTLRGEVCVNYLAKDLLNQVARVSAAAGSGTYLLNPEGYWLYDSEDPSREWAFMYADRSDGSFAVSSPEEWAAMQASSAGCLITDQGLFAFSRVFTSDQYAPRDTAYQLVLGEGDWTVVSHLPTDGPDAELLSWDLPQIVLYVVRTNWAIVSSLYIIAFTIAGLLAYSRRKRDRVRYFSEYDVMTGVFNRRAGLERIDRLRTSSRRAVDGTLVCFMDVNGLKQVNDTLGHEQGDALIRTVVDVARANLRKGDFIIRMGGDEFIIVMRGVDLARAEAVWDRIVAGYDEVNVRGDRPYRVSVSHGIVALVPGEDIDEAIHLADQLMYEEKRATKATAASSAAATSDADVPVTGGSC